MPPGSLAQTVSFNLILALLLCGAAGTLAWPEAWIFLVIFNVSSQTTGLWLRSNDPALLAERIKTPVDRDQKPRDRAAMGAVYLLTSAWIVFMGMDARRFGWSHAPAWLEAVGAALMLIAFYAWIGVLRANSFASSRVRLQARAGPDRRLDRPLRRRTPPHVFLHTYCFSWACHCCWARSGAFREHSSSRRCRRSGQSARNRCSETACRGIANTPPRSDTAWSRASGDKARQLPSGLQEYRGARAPIDSDPTIEAQPVQQHQTGVGLIMRNDQESQNTIDATQPRSTRRRLIRSCAQGAVAGTLLAGLASRATADTAMPKKGIAGAPSHERIRNLLAQYSFLLDAANYSEWGKLFGETGTLELNGAVWAQGSDGIAKKMAGVMAENPKPITGITGDHMYRHIFTNTQIRVDEAAGTAEADSYFFVLHVDKGVPPTIRGGGRYSDKFAKEGGEWHFTAKRMDFDWSDAA